MRQVTLRDEGRLLQAAKAGSLREKQICLKGAARRPCLPLAGPAYPVDLGSRLQHPLLPEGPACQLTRQTLDSSVPTIRWTDSFNKAQPLSLPLLTPIGLFLWNILTNLVIY